MRRNQLGVVCLLKKIVLITSTKTTIQAVKSQLIFETDLVITAIRPIEAKSGTGTTLTVPFDQIIRCLNWTNNFQVYKTREVILAFKFLSKKRIGVGKYEKRELREFFKIWNSKRTPIDIVCKYDGDTYTLKDGKKKKMSLKDYKMPFESRYQIFINKF